MDTLISEIGNLIKSEIGHILSFIGSIINNIFTYLENLLLPYTNFMFKFFFSSTDNVSFAMTGILTNYLIQKIIYYFQLVAIALLILKGFWDLLDNYVFLSGQSTTKSAINKIMAYIFAGVMVWIVPDLVEILIEGTLKMLRDLLYTFKSIAIFKSIVESTNVDLFHIVYSPHLRETIPNFLAMMIIIVGVSFIIMQIFIKAAKIMLLTVFLVLASVDLSSGSNGVFTKTLFNIMSQLLSICFQYILLAVFVYIMVSEELVNPNYANIGIGIVSNRILMGIGLITASIKTPEVLSSILENTGAGSSAAGFIKNVRLGYKA